MPSFLFSTQRSNQWCSRNAVLRNPLPAAGIASDSDVAAAQAISSVRQVTGYFVSR